MEGMPDWFESAMGMERGALETQELSSLNVGPELGSDMLESVVEGDRIILPDFYRNTAGPRFFPTRAVLEDLPMIPKADQDNYRLYYWPHRVEITTEDGKHLEYAGHPVTSEVYPGCAIASLFFFFQNHPNGLRDVVRIYGDKSKEGISMTNFVHDHFDLVQNFFNIFFVEMPTYFLEQDRSLKRVNPFRDPEPGQDPDDPVILYY